MIVVEDGILFACLLVEVLDLDCRDYLLKATSVVEQGDGQNEEANSINATDHTIEIRQEGVQAAIRARFSIISLVIRRRRLLLRNAEGEDHNHVCSVRNQIEHDEHWLE